MKGRRQEKDAMNRTATSGIVCNYSVRSGAWKINLYPTNVENWASS
jgi:hypothetical protein